MNVPSVRSSKSLTIVQHLDLDDLQNVMIDDLVPHSVASQLKYFGHAVIGYEDIAGYLASMIREAQQEMQGRNNDRLMTMFGVPRPDYHQRQFDRIKITIEGFATALVMTLGFDAYQILEAACKVVDENLSWEKFLHTYE